MILYSLDGFIILLGVHKEHSAFKFKCSLSRRKKTYKAGRDKLSCTYSIPSTIRIILKNWKALCSKYVIKQCIPDADSLFKEGGM